MQQYCHILCWRISGKLFRVTNSMLRLQFIACMRSGMFMINRTKLTNVYMLTFIDIGIINTKSLQIKMYLVYRYFFICDSISRKALQLLDAVSDSYSHNRILIICLNKGLQATLSIGGLGWGGRGNYKYRYKNSTPPPTVGQI